MEASGNGEKILGLLVKNSPINIVNCLFAINVKTPCLCYYCSSVFLVPTLV